MGLIVVSACAPGQPASRATTSSNAEQPSPSQPTRTLRVVIRAEPGSLAGTILIPTGITTSDQRRIFNAGLSLKDAEGVHRPYLAESLPQLQTDSWRVFPDGRMETTYRLRPNLVWQDGQPLTSEDFVFARSVYKSTDFGVANSPPHGIMEEVLAGDPRTVVVRWREPYPDAAELGYFDSLTPLPRHILAGVFERERENLPNHAFWTSEYVGAGPYRVDRWEPGAFIEAMAFDRHALGRPKIDRLKVTWNADFNVNMATLLAGDADVPMDDSIRVEQGLVLERTWASSGAGTMVYRAQVARFVQVQHRAEYANPQAVRDVRVRKALAHAIDRPAINEALFQGKGVTSDSLTYPTLDYFPIVDRATAKYPFDVRRTDQLLAEAGFSKDRSGIWANPSERLNLEARNIQSPQNDAERSIIADGWRRAGFEVVEDVFTPVQTRDGQLLGTFRSLSITSAVATPQGLKPDDATTAAVSRPETRWVGQNRGGWSNTEYDRLIAAWRTTLDRNQRNEFLAEAIRVRTEDLGVIPLHFNPAALAFVAGLHGIQLKAPDVYPSWNIHEWEWR
jgi:peptide/nickel transport system substrate-binding protein